MNNRRRLITSLLSRVAMFLVALSAASCSELDSGFREDVGPAGGIVGEVTMRYAIDGMSYQTRGSVIASAQETALNHVHLIFFSTLDESYITHLGAQVIQGAAGRTFSFSIPSELKQNIDYKVIVVGNGDNFIPIDEATGEPYESYGDYLGAICPGHTYSELQNALTFHYDLPMSSASTPILPMYGVLVNAASEEIPFNYTIEGDNYVVKGQFYFKRAVSRIDLTNLVTDKFMIDYVKVVNFRDGGYVFRDGSNTGEIRASIGDDRPAEGTDGWMAVDEKSQEIKSALYAFPNVVGSTGPDDEVTTALMIAGRYGTDTQTTYYRFNVCPVGESLSMQRNHIYTCTIKNITGRGDATEEEAMRRESPVLTAEVSENWGDDTSVTTDNQGNYLMLSRTTITLDGDAGLTEVIQVKISEGSKWRLQVDNQTGNSNDKFEFKEVDAESFAVTTKEDNTTYVLRKGFVNIVATTPQNTELVAPFIVQQVPNEEDPKYLLVENSSSDFNTTIAGVGGFLKLQIQTGSMVEGWKVTEIDNEGNTLTGTRRDPMTMNFKSIESSTFTDKGSHLGHLFINIGANITKSEREIHLLVEREMPEDTPDALKVDPIKINIKQPKSEYLVSVFPYPENGTLILEGFEPDLTSNSVTLGNAISSQAEFFVSLADPDNYTFEVSSSFDYYRDLRLSAHKRLPRNTKMNHYSVSNVPYKQEQTGNLRLTGLTNGQKFFINVFGTGPGDPNIDGEITIKAVPKNADKYESQEITFHVTIVTSCTLDDVFLPYGSNWLLVADRNCGAKPRLDDKKAFVPALNYAIRPYVHINGYGDIMKTDSNNADFKGENYQYSSSNDANWTNSLFFTGSGVTNTTVMYNEFTAKNLDEDELYSNFYHSTDRGWRVPSRSDWVSYISPYIRWSKYRAFLLSFYRDNRNGVSKYVGCFLPSSSANYYGRYMTADQYGNANGWVHDVNDDLGHTDTYQYKTYSYVIRPVRTVSPTEMNVYKAKFLGQ